LRHRRHDRPVRQAFAPRAVGAAQDRSVRLLDHGHHAHHGKRSLEDLIVSIDAQTVGPRLLHILLIDDFRSEGAASPESYDGPTRRSLVFPWGSAGTAMRPARPCAPSP